MEKQELIDMIENYDCNLYKVKNIVGLLWDLHVYEADNLKSYEFETRYRISQTLIDTLFDLLMYHEEESKKNINKIHKK